MFYFNNLPVWERLGRLVAGLAMISCGIHYYGTSAGWAFLVVGVVTLATGVVGFCPACALAGRRIAARARARG